ncbi:roadblock/LC7 domain-containing protein [Solimonas marina]|uniref:Roadblock/LAMTOR2 domain-containing protein n=1 Tax=Solimonas marina TaxID=2714601 RepID=A0A969W779_9GAMM|nr:roadblock/LC7 domain-containing protein [Solimonas marina]NKF20809.1 hypothetical protein [Solimonas marina]
MFADTPMPTPYDSALQSLFNQLPDIHSAVLARSDGFEIAQATRGTVAAARLAALASSMLALGTAALRELGLGSSGSVLIEGQRGKLLLLDVPVDGQPLVLAVVGSDSVITGSLLWVARDCVRQIVETTPNQGITS